MSAQSLYADLVGEDDEWSEEEYSDEEYLENYSPYAEPPKIVSKQIDTLPVATEKKDQEKTYCETCDLVLLKANYQFHITGKKHRNKLVDYRLKTYDENIGKKMDEATELFNKISIPKILEIILANLPPGQVKQMRLLSPLWNKCIENEESRSKILSSQIYRSDEERNDMMDILRMSSHFVFNSCPERFISAVQRNELGVLLKLKVYIDYTECLEESFALLSKIDCKDVTVVFTRDEDIQKTPELSCIRSTLVAIAENRNIQILTILFDGNDFITGFNALDVLQTSSLTTLNLSSSWFTYIKNISCDDVIEREQLLKNHEFYFNNRTLLTLNILPGNSGYKMGVYAGLIVLNGVAEGENKIDSLSLSYINSSSDNSELISIFGRKLSNWLASNPKIKYLDVSHNFFKYFCLDCLSNNTNLKTVVADNCSIDSMDTLFTYPSLNTTLEKLILSHSNMDRFKQRMLLNLPRGLKYLDWSYNSSSGWYVLTQTVFDSMAEHLSNLEELHIQGNRFEYFDIIANFLAETKTLRKLYIFEKTTYKSFKHNVEKVFENNTSLIFCDYQYLAGLTSNYREVENHISKVLERNARLNVGRRTKAVKR